MAKNNNFQDFVTDIANAIRIKNNSTDLLNPQDFYKEILKIGGYTDYKNIEYLEVEYNVTTTASTTTLFYNLSNFTSVYIDGQMVSSVSKNYQFSKTGKHYVRYYGMTSIPNNAFYQCKNIISVAISKNITSIGNYAFYHCDSLEKVFMGDSVRSIGDIAFSYCKSLESIELSSGLTSIGGSCFYECNSLIEVICRAKNAPTWGDNSVFYSIGNRGKLIHPMNSDYSSWMFFLSYFNWNEVESNFTDNSIFEGSDIIVESVQQFTTHIGNAIRKVKGFNDNLMINPQDYYDNILSI